jgi:hypothetical protein
LAVSGQLPRPKPEPDFIDLKSNGVKRGARLSGLSESSLVSKARGDTSNGPCPTQLRRLENRPRAQSSKPSPERILVKPIPSPGYDPTFHQNREIAFMRFMVRAGYGSWFQSDAPTHRPTGNSASSRQLSV